MPRQGGRWNDDEHRRRDQCGDLNPRHHHDQRLCDRHAVNVVAVEDFPISRQYTQRLRPKQRNLATPGVQRRAPARAAQQVEAMRNQHCDGDRQPNRAEAVAIWRKLDFKLEQLCSVRCAKMVHMQVH